MTKVVNADPGWLRHHIQPPVASVSGSTDPDSSNLAHGIVDPDLVSEVFFGVNFLVHGHQIIQPTWFVALTGNLDPIKHVHQIVDPAALLAAETQPDSIRHLHEADPIFYQQHAFATLDSIQHAHSLVSPSALFAGEINPGQIQHVHQIEAPWSADHIQPFDISHSHSATEPELYPSLGVANVYHTHRVSSPIMDGGVIVPAPGSKAVIAMQRLVASSETFQQNVGVENDIEALDFIYLLQTLQIPARETPGVLMTPRPFVTVDDDDQVNERLGRDEWNRVGVADIYFEFDIPRQYLADYQNDETSVIRQKFRDRQRWATNLTGLIRDEMCKNSGSHDTFGHMRSAIREVLVADGPGEPNDDEPNTWIGFTLQAEWY